MTKRAKKITTETPKVEAPKIEAPKIEAPKIEAPKLIPYVCKQCGKVALLVDRSFPCRRCGMTRWTPQVR